MQGQQQQVFNNLVQKFKGDREFVQFSIQQLLENETYIDQFIRQHYDKLYQMLKIQKMNTPQPNLVGNGMLHTSNIIGSENQTRGMPQNQISSASNGQFLSGGISNIGNGHKSGLFSNNQNQENQLLRSGATPQPRNPNERSKMLIEDDNNDQKYMNNKQIQINIGGTNYKFQEKSEFTNSPIIQYFIHNYQKYQPHIDFKFKSKNQQISKITDHFYLSVAEFICHTVQDQEQKKNDNHKYDKHQECSICMTELYDIENMQKSEFEQLMQNNDDDNDVMRLNKCDNHYFHVGCFINYLISNKMTDHTTCPICQRIYGIKKGNQPPGTMQYKIIKYSCQGYENYDTIQIDYHFPSGQHKDINNGVAYTGTSRRGFLPNNTEGQKVFGLLQESFNRKLTFIVGTSITTGQHNCVVWGGIHHKTSMNGGPFGYPDKTYLTRVQEELASKGVY